MKNQKMSDEEKSQKSGNNKKKNNGGGGGGWSGGGPGPSGGKKKENSSKENHKGQQNQKPGNHQQDNRSTSSSNTTNTIRPSAAPPKAKARVNLVQILQRTTPPTSSSTSAPSSSAIKANGGTTKTTEYSAQGRCSPVPLMSVNAVMVHQPIRINKNENQSEESMKISELQATANKQQRQAYYFSQNAGNAMPASQFQEAFQYRLNNFPLDQNVDILIDQKWNLLITRTSGRCKALFIRVKSQCGDTRQEMTAGALLKPEAKDKEIRKACLEVIEIFNHVLTKKPKERDPFCKVSEPFLLENFIKRLEDRLDAFPEAIYYCEKCDYHINTMSHAKSHLESSTHFDDVERQQQRLKLLEIVEEPTIPHLEAINIVLQETLKEYQQIKEAGENRADIILYYLKTSLFQTLGYSEVTLKTFGSATYDVVLPDSDLNVAFTMELPEGTMIFSFLEKIRSQLSAEGHQADMDMGTSSAIVFYFEDVRVRLCWMSSFNCRSQLYFTQLMQTYTGLRPEVVEFLQLIRLWAARAEVDSKNRMRIGLPRYGFDIMAIHFLQQEGYLPVLHELYEGAEEEDAKEQEQEKKAETTSPADEDTKTQPEEARQRRLRLMSKYLKDKEKIRSAFPGLDRPWNLAHLWLGFFRYFVRHNREIVVQITQKSPMTRDFNKWNKKILHVVDPFRSDNVLSIPKVSTWQPYFFNCLLATFISFAVPQNENGPLVEWALTQNKSPAKRKKEPAVASQKRPQQEAVRSPGPTVTHPPQSLLTMRIDEESAYNEAADEIAEEEERERYCQELRNRLSFDGILLKNLKMEDVEIDDHLERIYSRRTIERVKRVHPMIDEDWKMRETINLHGILKRNYEKKLHKRYRRLDEAAKAAELENEQKREDASIEECTVMMASTTIWNIVPQCNVEEYKPEKKVDELIKDVDVGNSEDLKEKKDEKNLETPPETTVPSTKANGKLPVGQKTEENTGGATFVVRNLTDTTKISPENQICTEEFFVKEKNVPADWKKRAAEMKTMDYRFKFTHSSFSGGYEMEMKCTHCDGGHCVEKCPMMQIPPIEKFPPRTAQELKDIDDIIDKFHAVNSLDTHRLKLLESKVLELETYLKVHFKPEVNLTIFGSVMTGLSVNCSDIDICLRFGEGDEPPPGVSPKSVIEKTEAVLRNSNLAKRVQAITSAKVPIVKFQLKLKHDDIVDVDVSYYNILALYNTNLLREYTLWTPDNRFAKLALFIKHWAKWCDIGDASRGSLSSYAHIILLISYLQQCDPPVLPRLQEDFRNGNSEHRIIENWDTSFVQAEDSLISAWPKNKESCAQLLIGYMDYYSRFDFRNFVVQSRREMILCKMEKEWQKPLCVEDPFDLSHNLSTGITKKMYVFILKVFIASRAVFMSVKPEVPRDSNFLDNYRKQLLEACSQGSAPNDRQCHQCHRIGHFFESCPQRNQIKEARRRYGSNSSYRSAGTNSREDDGVQRLQYHKRAFHRRSNR